MTATVTEVNGGRGREERYYGLGSDNFIKC